MPELALLVGIVLVLVALRLLLLRPVVMEYQAGLLYRNGRFRRRLPAACPEKRSDGRLTRHFHA